MQDQIGQQANMPLADALKQQNQFRSIGFNFPFNRNRDQSNQAPAPVTLPESLKAFGFQESDLPYLKQSDLKLAYEASGQNAVYAPGMGLVAIPSFGGLINRQRGINPGNEEAKNALTARLLEMNTRRDNEARAAAAEAQRQELARIRQAGIDNVISSNPLPLGSLNQTEAAPIYDLQKQGYSFDQARKKTVKDLYGIDEDLT